MPNYVYIGGQRISLSPTREIGKGGEAEIFDIGGGRVVKIYKSPTHPDYAGVVNDQKAARERIATHQRKLPAFPKGLPSRVVTPIELATDQSGRQVLGYTMAFLQNAEVLMRYTERPFREAGVSNDAVLQIFRDLHATVMGVHQKQVVIGDFNDLNILVRGTEAHVVDADSFQFGNFPCTVFTARFVDPLLCDPMARFPMLVKPHNVLSDWYAYAVMLMQCLLFVDPYGGVYVPKNLAKKIPHTARPLHRITVFHPEVRYPKPAVHFSVLPDGLLEFFHRVFENDARSEFPVKLLEMRWTKCINCGTEHARSVCPECAEKAPVSMRQITTIRGKVTATRLFTTPGLIVFAAVQNGKLHYLYHEGGVYKREGDRAVFQGAIDPQMRYRIQGEATLLGKNGRLVILAPNKASEQVPVESYGTLPVFDANASSYFFLQNGKILRNGQWAPEQIGQVLEGRTLFWTGPDFGFGFSRAGGLQIVFVFDAKSRGLNDSVKLEHIRGQLVDSTAVFGRDRCWFFIATQESGKTIHRAYLVRGNGSVEASAEAEANDGSWLGTIRGKCASSNFLLAATDDGLVRLEADNGKIIVAREFPDTEPFVSSASNLFASSDGLYVVGRKEVVRLTIA